MSRSSTSQSSYRRFEVVRSKFSPKVVKQLLQFLATIDWNSSVENICNELHDVTQSELGGKFVWMVGANPTYFIQYQTDSYAIIKGYGKVILVWKPKYLEYPSIIKLSEFGSEPKLIKSMQVLSEHRGSDVSDNLQNNTIEYVKMYYGLHFFNHEQAKFQTDMLTEIKHYISRTSKDSYWHCVIDNHGGINVSSQSSLYLKLRIKGVKQKYDKDLIIFSQKGVRQFALKGKGIQIVSFVAMLLIFIAIVSCPSGSQTGFCSHKNQLIVASAAVMMGLMGMRVVSRNKQKKKLDKRIKELQQKQKQQ